MDEVKKSKNMLMEKSRLKPQLLGIMRIAVVMHISKNLHGEN